jgi:hypothetical protein
MSHFGLVQTSIVVKKRLFAKGGLSIKGGFVVACVGFGGR